MWSFLLGALFPQANTLFVKYFKGLDWQAWEMAQQYDGSQKEQLSVLKKITVLAVILHVESLNSS